MIRVALLEADRRYREGIASVLTTSGRYSVVASFGKPEDALRELPRRAATVVLCDSHFQYLSGAVVVRRLRESCPGLSCVMLTSADDTRDLFAALRAGAAGYLLKSSSPEELLAGLDELAAGGVPMSRPIARRVLGSFAPTAARPKRPDALTAREAEILDHLTRGLTYKEIAAELGISLATVKNHLHHGYQKLGVRSGTEAVLKWLGRKAG